MRRRRSLTRGICRSPTPLPAGPNLNQLRHMPARAEGAWGYCTGLPMRYHVPSLAWIRWWVYRGMLTHLVQMQGTITPDTEDPAWGLSTSGGGTIAVSAAVAQVATYTITAVDETDYTVEVDGNAVTINSGVGASTASIATALAAAITAAFDHCSGAESDPDVVVTAATAGEGFTATESDDNITLVQTTANDVGPKVKHDAFGGAMLARSTIDHGSTAAQKWLQGRVRLVAHDGGTFTCRQLLITDGTKSLFFDLDEGGDTIAPVNSSGVAIGTEHKKVDALPAELRLDILIDSGAVVFLWANEDRSPFYEALYSAFSGGATTTIRVGDSTGGGEGESDWRGLILVSL